MKRIGLLSLSLLMVCSSGWAKPVLKPATQPPAKLETKMINGHAVTREEFEASKAELGNVTGIVDIFKNSLGMAEPRENEKGKMAPPDYEDAPEPLFTAKRAQEVATYFPFVNVNFIFDKTRLELPSGILSRELLSSIILDRISIRDAKKKVLVEETRDLKQQFGSFDLKTKFQIKDRADLLGARGKAYFHLAVPTAFETIELKKVGESKRGWTLVKLTSTNAVASCALKNCDEFEFKLPAADGRFVRAQGSSRGTGDFDEVFQAAIKEMQAMKWEDLPAVYEFKPKPSNKKVSYDISVDFNGPVAALQLTRATSSKMIRWVSQVVPTTFIEDNVPGYYAPSKSELASEGICNNSTDDLQKNSKSLFPFEFKRNEDSDKDRVGFNFGVRGPRCLNSTMASAYAAYELYSGDRDLTGKIPDLAGQFSLSPKSLSFYLSEKNRSTQENFFTKPEDIEALKNRLRIRGDVTILYPAVAIEDVPIGSAKAKALGLKIEKVKQGYVISLPSDKADRTEFILKNGFALRSSSQAYNNNTRLFTFPVRPEFLRTVVKKSESEIRLSVTSELKAVSPQ